MGVMASPYVEMARLKGIGPLGVVVRHALPNALSPIINVVIINLAYLVVGVVVIEVVFVYPGVGQYMVDGVSKRDLPVVQACGLVFALLGAPQMLLSMAQPVTTFLSKSYRQPPHS